MHASRYGYCVVCGMLSNKPEPLRKDGEMVICSDCSLKRTIWRDQGPSPV